MSTTTHAAPLVAGVRTREVLLACGPLSSLVYVVNDVIGSIAWKDHSSFSQTISELSAIDAPSRRRNRARILVQGASAQGVEPEPVRVGLGPTDFVLRSQHPAPPNTNARASSAPIDVESCCTIS